MTIVWIPNGLGNQIHTKKKQSAKKGWEANKKINQNNEINHRDKQQPSYRMGGNSLHKPIFIQKCKLNTLDCPFILFTFSCNHKIKVKIARIDEWRQRIKGKCAILSKGVMWDMVQSRAIYKRHSFI